LTGGNDTHRERKREVSKTSDRSPYRTRTREDALRSWAAAEEAATRAKASPAANMLEEVEVGKERCKARGEKKSVEGGRLWRANERESWAFWATNRKWFRDDCACARHPSSTTRFKRKTFTAYRSDQSFPI
jgi:hypothetical protein